MAIMYNSAGHRRARDPVEVSRGRLPGRPGVVLVFGTFDRLHSGHLLFLRAARARARRLVVSLARDAFVRAHKGRLPAQGEAERARRVRETGLVSTVYRSDAVPGSFRVVRIVRPDRICLGFDQLELEAALRLWAQRSGADPQIERLPHFAPGEQ